MLTAEQRQKGQRSLLWFGVFNAFSFTLATGNLVSLYLLRLGASNALIGTVASFSFVAFLLLFVGRILVPRVGVMRLMAWAWLLRYLALLPLVMAPAFVAAGQQAFGFALIVAGSLGFHLFRGVGLVANAPMFAGFASDADRGSLLGMFQITAALVSLTVGLVVAFLLGEEAAIGRYVVFIGLGIAAGFVACGIVFSLPELDEHRQQASRPISPVLGSLLRNRDLRRYFLMFFAVALSSGVARSFLVVYAKQVHGYDDSLAFLLVAVGSVGNLAAGFLGSRLLDRLGARPLILFSSVGFLASVVAAIVIPVGASGAIGMVVMGLIFFVATLGFAGNESSSQAYFFGITDRDDQLNLGIGFFLVLGTGGTIGAFAGGLLLDALAPLVGTVWAFRILFSLVAAILVFGLSLTAHLPTLGAETFRGTLGVIFSPRDLRTVGLLNRLNRSTDRGEQVSTLRDLARSGSRRAVDDVLDRLTSPAYPVRQEALEALHYLPYSRQVEMALIDHIQTATHTTAFQAVRLLGLRGSPDAIPAVREAIDRDDPLLADRALVAYARLAGAGALPRVHEVIADPRDPRAILHAAVSLQIAGTSGDLPPLLAHLKREAVPDYVADEILFTAAKLLEMQVWLYPLYTRFIQNAGDRHAVMEELASEHGGRALPSALESAVTALFVEEDPERALELIDTIATQGDNAAYFTDLRASERVAFVALAAAIHSYTGT